MNKEKVFIMLVVFCVYFIGMYVGKSDIVTFYYDNYLGIEEEQVDNFESWKRILKDYIGNKAEVYKNEELGIIKELIYEKGISKFDIETGKHTPIAIQIRSIFYFIPLQIYKVIDGKLVLVWENDWIGRMEQLPESKINIKPNIGLGA